jgi:hypothetical protein
LRAVEYGLILLVLALALAPCTLTFAFASACSAQLGYPIIPLANIDQPVTAVVPVSATCSTSYGQQLYATATAYDLNTNTSTGTVNTILTSVDGGYTFTGQLGFTLPPSAQGHWVQIAVTIYASQSTVQLTTVGEAFPVTVGTGQIVTSTVTEEASNQFAPEGSGVYQRSRFIFALVAIAAILATVIIVTVGLIAYSRRPTGYYQVPRTY